MRSRKWYMDKPLIADLKPRSDGTTNYWLDSANHHYTVHSTYTGKGCALCGKTKEEHPLDKAKEKE
jgi:hypothetical protein